MYTICHELPESLWLDEPLSPLVITSRLITFVNITLKHASHQHTLLLYNLLRIYVTLTLNWNLTNFFSHYLNDYLVQLYV